MGLEDLGRVCVQTVQSLNLISNTHSSPCHGAGGPRTSLCADSTVIELDIKHTLLPMPWGWRTSDEFVCRQYSHWTWYQTHTPPHAMGLLDLGRVCVQTVQSLNLISNTHSSPCHGAGGPRTSLCADSTVIELDIKHTLLPMPWGWWTSDEFVCRQYSHWTWYQTHTPPHAMGLVDLGRVCVQTVESLNLISNTRRNTGWMFVCRAIFVKWVCQVSSGFRYYITALRAFCLGSIQCQSWASTDITTTSTYLSFRSYKVSVLRHSFARGWRMRKRSATRKRMWRGRGNRGGSRNSSGGGGRSSKRQFRGNFQTDKQKKPLGLNPPNPLPGSATGLGKVVQKVWFLTENDSHLAPFVYQMISTKYHSTETTEVECKTQTHFSWIIL